MVPTKEYTDNEVIEIMYKLGDLILSVECGGKMIPDKAKTAWLAIQMAHSMLGDVFPEREDS